MRRKASDTAAVSPPKPREKTGNTVRAKRKNGTPKPLQAAHTGEAENAAANRERAFELRRQRLSYREIAKKLGVSAKTAFVYVDEYWAQLDAVTKEKAELVRDMELETLDALQARWEPLALHPCLDVQKVIPGTDGEVKIIRMEDFDAGLKAADKVLKIMERRARLLGLDAALKVEGDVKHTHMTLEEMEKRLRDAQQ